jgi:excisionase family DNA binding protein
VTPLMTFDETAAVLRISPDSLRTMVKHRRAPKSYRVGKRRMFDPDDVRAWLNSNATEPRSAA